MPDSSKDCFARDKFADYRDDMGGVGSFNRQNRTLYVGRIKETGNGQETEEVVTRHFREWGTIERSTSFLFFFSPSTVWLGFRADNFFLNSTCPAISQRRLRDLRLRIPCPIRKGSHGVPISR